MKPISRLSIGLVAVVCIAYSAPVFANYSISGIIIDGAANITVNQSNPNHVIGQGVYYSEQPLELFLYETNNLPAGCEISTTFQIGYGAGTQILYAPTFSYIGQPGTFGGECGTQGTWHTIYFSAQSLIEATMNSYYSSTTYSSTTSLDLYCALLKAFQGVTTQTFQVTAITNIVGATSRAAYGSGPLYGDDLFSYYTVTLACQP